MKTLALIVGMALVALLVVAGCGGGSNVSTSAGMVKLLLADAPLHLDDGSVVAEVNVTITRVELLADDGDEGGKVVLFEGSQAVDLLTLANKPLDQLLQLALTTVPAGTYNQLRFIVDEAGSSVVVNGQSQPLKVASGPQTGLKLVDLNIVVAPGATQVVLVDFDLSKLHQNNQFLLTPNALRVAKMSESGTVAGTVALPAGLEPAEAIPATVTIQQAGGTEPMATTQVLLTTDIPQGTFVINGVPAGAYVVTVTAAYDGRTATVDTQATVTAGGTADLGTVELTELAPPPAEPPAEEPAQP